MEQNNGLNKAIRQFKDFYNKGRAYLESACKVYVAEIDRDENSRYVFKNKFPEIPNIAWTRFEKVGRGTLAAELLFGGTQCVELIARAPVSVQKEIVKKGLPVLQDGKIRNVPVSSVTSNMAYQAIASDGHIRTKDEQEVHISSKGKNPRSEQQSKKDWEVRGSRVKFLSARYFTKSEILKILEEMK